MSYLDNIDFITIAFNLQPHQIKTISSSLTDGIFHIFLSLNPHEKDCPFCGGKIKIQGYTERTLHHSPAFSHPCIIHWKRTRFICKDCSKTFSEENIFSPEHFRHTYPVLHQIAIDLKNPHFTFEDIAKKHNISITLAMLYADSFLQVPRLRLPVNLGIDEIHSDMAKFDGAYLCTFVDNNYRCLNEILPDRSKRTLSKHLEKIPLDERKRVKFVTMDMWQPYKDVSLKYFPNAIICIDNFHVVSHVCDNFSRFRIDLMNSYVHGSPAYYLLKHWHKLLETDKYNLDYDNPPKYNSYFRQHLNYRDLYDMLLSLNPTLTLAYNLKEKYRLFNKNATEDNCEAQLDQLIKEFYDANLPFYQEFLSILTNWRTEIINSFKRPFDNRKQSNALAEYMNGRLRNLIDNANGYSNFERFRSRALYCFNDHLMYSLTQKLFSPNKKKLDPRGKYNKKSNNLLSTSPDNIIEDDPMFSEE